MYTMEDWNKDGSFNAEIGQVVEEAIVNSMITSVSPICMRLSCMQVGSPFSLRIDPDIGIERNTFLTFAQDKNRQWIYCGDCFAGESEIRGDKPAYI